MKHLLYLFTAVLVIACNNTNNTANNGDSNTDPVDTTAAHALTSTDNNSGNTAENNDVPTSGIAEIIKRLDATAASQKPKEYDVTVQDKHECHIEDYGDKKCIFCFAGGLKAQDIKVYYDNEAPVAAIYTIEHYNASPANLAAFDESKTIKKQLKLHFKAGSLDEFEQILDMDDHAASMDEEQTADWNIATAAIPPM